MTEVTKADINRIYDKLDPIAVDVAVIKTKIEGLNQPCTQLTTHIDSHRDTIKTWKHSVIGGAVKIVVASIVGAVCYLWGTRK